MRQIFFLKAETPDMLQDSGVAPIHVTSSTSRICVNQTDWSLFSIYFSVKLHICVEFTSKVWRPAHRPHLVDVFACQIHLENPQSRPVPDVLLFHFCLQGTAKQKMCCFMSVMDTAAAPLIWQPVMADASLLRALTYNLVLCAPCFCILLFVEMR